MAKKRLIAVVTVKNGWAVQSMGFSQYLPLGKPECVVENLDRWGADEILLQVIDRHGDKNTPDFDLIRKIAGLGISTPLIYSGGVHSVEQGVMATQLGADRVAVCSSWMDVPEYVEALAATIGAQALIAAVPVANGLSGIEWFDYRRKSSCPDFSVLKRLVDNGAISELLLMDWVHEGSLGGFEQSLVDDFPLQGVQTIVFGGITDANQMQGLLARDNVVAVAVGNTLNYTEHALQKLKQAMSLPLLRPPVFESRHVSFLHD